MIIQHRILKDFFVPQRQSQLWILLIRNWPITVAVCFLVYCSLVSSVFFSGIHGFLSFTLTLLRINWYWTWRSTLSWLIEKPALLEEKSKKDWGKRGKSKWKTPVVIVVVIEVYLSLCARPTYNLLALLLSVLTLPSFVIIITSHNSNR